MLMIRSSTRPCATATTILTRMTMRGQDEDDVVLYYVLIIF
jgi:hypothetical protein